MRIRPWAYLAMIAWSVFWGLPGIVLWVLTGIMLADAARVWIRPAARRLDRCLHTPLGHPGPVTLTGGPDGSRWRISSSGLMTRECAHHDAVEVRRLAVPAVGVAADVVAWWCPACQSQLPADWVRDGQMTSGPAVSFLNVEQAAAIKAAFLRGQKSRAPVWINDDNQIIVTPPARHVCDPVRCRTGQQVEAQTGRHAVEVTAIGDPHRRYLAGAPIACSHCGSRSLSPVAPIICLDCGASA